MYVNMPYMKRLGVVSFICLLATVFPSGKNPWVVPLARPGRVLCLCLVCDGVCVIAYACVNCLWRGVFFVLVF